MRLKGIVNTLQLRAAPREHNAIYEVIARKARAFNLRLHVLYNLFHASIDDFRQFSQLFHASAITQLQGLRLADGVEVGITMCELQVFSLIQLHVEDIGNVARDAGTSERNDAEMPEQLSAIDGNGGRLASHIYEGTSRRAFLLRRQDTCQDIGTDKDASVSDIYLCAAEAMVNGLQNLASANDIEEACFNARGHCALRVERHLRGRQLIFYGNRLDDFMVSHASLIVLHGNRGDELIGHHFAAGHLHEHAVRHGAQPHTSDSRIEEFDMAFGHALKMLLDARQARGHLIDVQHPSFGDEIN